MIVKNILTVAVLGMELRSNGVAVAFARQGKAFRLPAAPLPGLAR
jgi:hypothetical protein